MSLDLAKGQTTTGSIYLAVGLLGRSCISRGPSPEQETLDENRALKLYKTYSEYCTTYIHSLSIPIFTQDSATVDSLFSTPGLSNCVGVSSCVEAEASTASAACSVAICSVSLT